MTAIEPSSSLEARIRGDQLADLKAGLFFSMPTSAVLSALILAVQWLEGSAFAAIIWFLVVNAINSTRLVLAHFKRGKPTYEDELRAASKELRLYGIFALLSGFAWSYLSVLTGGYTAPQSTVHLTILAGISAGAVTYGSSYAASPISFITPPLIITAVCLAAKGSVQDYILAFAVLLFLVGLVRISFIGQNRFREASRLRHEAEQNAAEMEQKSWEDPLTGLLNRRGLEHTLGRNAKMADGPFVTIMIDVDGFKSVNDTYGHKIGDDLLTRIARRIKEELPSDVALARIGGDEFVIVFCLSNNPISPTELASRIINRIAVPYRGVASIKIGASAGVYLSDTPLLTEMLLRADMALYSAKRRGRNEVCLFDAEVEEVLQRRKAIERDLRETIESRNLGVWFQPIVRLDSGAVVGFEALLRWSHPRFGDISPPEVVTAARETGVLQLLTESVFRDCCALVDDLTQADCRHIRVAMNLSPRELEAGNIDELILDGLEIKGLPASMFEIEITEESPVDPERVDEKLSRLSAAGISIALDDFGTGFSTLAALKDGRISKVKIDQTFVRGLANSQENQLLVKAVIDLGRTLGIEVMAEGVETDADRRSLQALGCRMAQGFLFSKAVPPKQALDMAVTDQLYGSAPRELRAGEIT